MKKIFIIILITFINTKIYASNKENIIKNLTNINNITFDFEQNINGKIENGICTIEYPKKFFVSMI